ncbi:uncharacterized protein LOC121378333 isoform X3 [Gigantopelta aegis]|uniref:uncharacterized protein LOC121378333 isoform X3 n=1 Tax=Gigantopelta aegis TaxID=1735272 RepID=UPI001B88C247|nr:uncharacterized protein LOC121378333 isoform X3 [Gigantopelta aegis]XP_041362390.1 uncharacterized protein LOC121378333 isoform X3 [Gigantopelta aegis]
MSGSAYHWDALRKERILQRKREALRRLQNPDPVIDNTGRTKKREEPLVIADQGEFVNLRSRKANTCTNKMQIGALDSNILGADSGVVFENVTHDPNYKYRLHRHSCLPPVHVDPIYGLIYPGSFKYTASCSCRTSNEMTSINKAQLQVLKPKPKPGSYIVLEPEQKAPPPSIRKIQRSHVFKILHPYDFYTDVIKD